MPRPRREVPWLEWHENGTAYVFWYDADNAVTKRQSLKTRDAAKAAVRYAAFLFDFFPQVPAPGRPVRITVRKALADYLREHVEAVDDKGRALVADQSRQKDIAKHLIAHFGDADILSIGPAESRAYMAARREGRVGGGKRRKTREGKDGTIRRELNCLIAAFNHEVREGKLGANTRARIALPIVEESSGKPKWLTKDEVELALMRSEGAFHDYIVMLYYTGARRRAIENLTKQQVDLENGTIDLMTPADLPVTNRRITARRTKKRRPTVPIFPEMKEAVERRMAAAEGVFLFPQYSQYAVWFPWMMKEEFGIEAKVHSLRHSRASHLLQDGKSIFHVARLLGDTVATVERVYGHASPDFLLNG